MGDFLNPSREFPIRSHGICLPVTNEDDIMDCILHGSKEEYSDVDIGFAPFLPARFRQRCHQCVLCIAPLDVPCRSVRAYGRGCGGRVRRHGQDVLFPPWPHVAQPHVRAVGHQPRLDRDRVLLRRPSRASCSVLLTWALFFLDRFRRVKIGACSYDAVFGINGSDIDSLQTFRDLGWNQTTGVKSEHFMYHCGDSALQQFDTGVRHIFRPSRFTSYLGTDQTT